MEAPLIKCRVDEDECGKANQPSTPTNRPVRIQEKKKKMETEVPEALKASREMGRLAACLDPRPCNGATQRGKRPFNRNLLSYQFRSVQALQLLVMEACNSELSPKISAKS